MDDHLPNPGRRRLLAAALLPDLDRLLGPLQPKMGSYEEWFASLRTDDTKRLEALLARGFDPNSIEPTLFDTSLIVAIRHKSAKAIALLLSLDDLDIEAQSRNGDTALMIACWLSDTKTALALIERGAEINRPGWAALHYAAASGDVEIIRRLLEESAYIDAESPNGTTPLMMAARGGRRDAMLLLLDEGADLMLKNERGMTAADFARRHGYADLARLLDERAVATGKDLPAAAQSQAAPPSDAESLTVPAEAAAAALARPSSSAKKAAVPGDGSGALPRPVNDKDQVPASRRPSRAPAAN